MQEDTSQTGDPFRTTPTPDGLSDTTSHFPRSSNTDTGDTDTGDSRPTKAEPPPQFGRYRIVRKLGGGGMGAVYEAIDTHLDRRVALKTPHAALMREPAAVERFYREAQAAAQLMHENLCPVFDVGQIQGLHYLTMHYIEGRPLSCLARDMAEQPPAKAAALIETLARALAVAHARGVIHRDLKPSNIVITPENRPVIVDFGLALRLGCEDPRQTSAGAHLGTPAYMAPEQADGLLDQMGASCDIYSLGVVLYELLCGRCPFRGTITQIMRQHVCDAPPPPSEHRPDLDRNLEAICLKALAKRPEDRFASMLAFADALKLHLAGGPSNRRTVGESAAAPPSDPRFADEVIALMHQWGWETGLAKLKQQIAATTDPKRRASLKFLLGWIAGERGAHAEALEHFQAAGQRPDLRGWALLGEAFLALRQKNLGLAHALLDQAAATAAPTDTVVRGTLAHCRGAVLHHQGRLDESLEQLFAALELFGLEHFGTGRTLDTLGMVYKARGDFLTARELFLRALKLKTSFDDDAGMAVSHGQLGRLFLDWGDLDRAEEHFRADLDIAQRICDLGGEAQMYNHLGQLLLARGQLDKAADYLDESIRLNKQQARRPVAEGYARKDRALAHLKLGELEEAQREAEAAQALFESVSFAEGQAHTARVHGMILCQKGRHSDAERLLQRSAGQFDEQKEPVEAARSLLELARVRRQRGARPGMIVEVLQSALNRAEHCRRDTLIREIEEELFEVDEAELCRRVYRRARGRGIREDTISLRDGRGELASVLFFDLRNFTLYTRNEDPQLVIITLNQIFAELSAALDPHEVLVNQYLGDGFMALSRGPRHAQRAILGGLAMLAALETFNRPRRILGLPQLEARIGVASGAVVFGNVGTYRKIDFTAVGATTNLAARLQTEARPGAICISHETYQLVKDSFNFAASSPRTASLKNFDEQTIWDAVSPTE